MSLIDKLPLIRGWAWREVSLTRTILLTQELLVYQAPPPTKEIGWVVGIDFLSNDAYLGLGIDMPGVPLTGYNTFAGARAIGAVLPPPSGLYLGLYNQPNPLRTIGEYQMSVITSAYPWPFYGPVRLHLSLRPESTEPHATGAIFGLEIVVQDRNLFLKDLRKVLYGRWAPLLDLIGHVPLLRSFTEKFAELRIPFEEKERVEPPGVAR